ncbi:bola protein [Microdochium bolleyi]|uniref:Bola protein n=1 Tax=Microdochium bolleyi TaxID=196109 RepID=A0A136JCJ6_9PEZI|nr:bola protein [Microdochium bolleyi]
MLCTQCRRLAVRAATRSSASLRPLAAPAASASFTTKSTVSTLLRQTSTSRLGASRSKGASFLPTFRSYSTDSASPSAPPAKPDYLDDAESQIWDKLAAEFAPTELSVQDISGGCGSMYGIEIASEKFRGTNMLKQQRMVNAVLGEQMKSWHGVQLRTKIPPA